MYCKERLRRPHSGLTLVWSILEKTDRYAPFLGAPCVSTIWALVDAIQGGARAVVYAPGLDRVAEQFDYFCRIVADCHSVRCVVEELSRVTSASWAPPAWSNLSTAGAHQHLELIATAQRPTMIDKNFLSNCTAMRCFRVGAMFAGDARTMAHILRVLPDAVMDLPKFHYLHRVVEDRVTVAGVQSVLV
jgi:hypothetical protein